MLGSRHQGKHESGIGAAGTCCGVEPLGSDQCARLALAGDQTQLHRGNGEVSEISLSRKQGRVAQPGTHVVLRT